MKGKRKIYDICDNFLFDIDIDKNKPKVKKDILIEKCSSEEKITKK